MKLSGKSRYATEAIFYLAACCGGQPVSIRRISEDTGISEGYLEQIFFRLRKSGLLCAVRGAGGGFTLARAAADITVGDILRAMGDPLVPVVCVDDLSACKSKIKHSCVTRGLWIQTAHTLEKFFDNVTIESLRQQFWQEENIQ